MFRLLGDWLAEFVDIRAQLNQTLITSLDAFSALTDQMEQRIRETGRNPQLQFTKHILPQVVAIQSLSTALQIPVTPTSHLTFLAWWICLWSDKSVRIDLTVVKTPAKSLCVLTLSVHLL